MKYYWEQCYEGCNGEIYWALCDSESAKQGRVSCSRMVLNATYDTCCDGLPLSEQPLPALIVRLLNEHIAKRDGNAMLDPELKTHACMVALKMIKYSLDRLWKSVQDGMHDARSLVGDETLRIHDQFEALAKLGIRFGDRPAVKLLTDPPIVDMQDRK